MRHCSQIKKGNVAKPLRLALGACIIQTEYGYSDEETALQIQENAYLQYFCGYKNYDNSKSPFDASFMIYFRKRLTPEILGEINEIILEEQGTTKVEDDDFDNNNSGTMIVDATNAPSQIKYPQDTALLNQAREIIEELIDTLHTPSEAKPRTYRKQAHKDYLSIAKNRKPTAKKIRKAIGKQLCYLRRNLEHIHAVQTSEHNLRERRQAQLATIQTLYEQQKFIYDNQCHRVPNRIVSLQQPYLRSIMRGKAKATVEFGAKLDISVCNGWTRLEVLSF